MWFPINNYHIQTPKRAPRFHSPMTLYMLFLLSQISSPHFLPNKSLLVGEGSHVPDHPWLIIPGTAVQSRLGPGTCPYKEINSLHSLCWTCLFARKSFPIPGLMCTSA